MYIIILVKQVYWYISRVSGERLQDHWSSGLLTGSGLGHFIFGAFTAMFYEKFERLKRQLYEEDNTTLVTDDNSETIMTHGSQHM